MIFSINLLEIFPAHSFYPHKLCKIRFYFQRCYSVFIGWRAYNASVFIWIFTRLAFVNMLMHVVTLNFVFNHDDNERDINHNLLWIQYLAVRRLIRPKKRSKWRMIANTFLQCICIIIIFVSLLCNIDTCTILWLKFNFNLDFPLKGKLSS